jgi:hypothetical protein
MIYLNEVYMNVDKNEYIRIINIDANNDIFHFVICFKNYAYPKPYKISLFQDEIDKKIIVNVPDIFTKVIDEESITKSDLEKRDFYWQIVDKYWRNNKDELLTDGKCRKLFLSISNEYKLSESTVIRIFSRFFERGMNKNALLSNYSNSGGRGKEKQFKTKTGRPRTYGKSKGIIITDEIKAIFQLGIDKYYYNEKNNSIREVFTAILREFFSYKTYENGELKYTLFEEDRLPTYKQFYYQFKNVQNKTKEIITRQSEKEFDLKNRPILSNSTVETIGPGTRFQVDATIADIYLVSKFDKERIIGRPVVYAIIDVFSRMVTGIYVGLEGPSWVGAMMALDNMVADKVEFCKSYEIDIEEKEWPSHHLPQIILADRGEFEGYSVENLINNLGIVVENTPPYRGDLKGIVERNFRTLNEKVKHKTPGAIMKEYRKRGDEDYRKKAEMTIEEFTKLYIRLVIRHNNTIIEKYPMEIDMIADEVSPIPTELWRWGIQNKKGGLRVIDREIMRLNVLPKAKANVSRSGIKFKGLFYSSQKAIEEQWFIKNKIRSVNISYDPRDLNYLYIIDNDGRSYDKCFLLDSCMQYKEAIIEEVEYFRELKREIINEKEQINLQKICDLDKEIEDIVKKAEKSSKENIALKNLSDSQKIKNIRKNRMIEKELNRDIEKFELGKQLEIEGKRDAKEIDKKDTSNISYIDNLYEKIRQKGHEKLDREK